MKRRNFFNLIGHSAVVAAGSNACSHQKPIENSSVLVDTEEQRMAYLAKMLKSLSTDLDPRLAGTEAYNKAALIVKKEMELSLPTVSMDTLNFEGWELTGEPEFFIGNEKIEAYPTIGSRGTPPEGISGIVQKIDDRVIPYGIVNPDSNELLSYIYVWNGAARGRSCVPFGKQPGCLPFFVIGKADEELLLKAIDNRTPVRCTSHVKYFDTSASNVIGTLHGESSDEIVFMAHLDSVYTSPGANDNAASLIAILMLAHAVSGSRPKNTLTFIASAAEEIGILGAKHFVERRKAEGTFENIKYSFCFDSVTWGPNISFQTTDDDTRTLFQSIDNEKQINGRVRLINRSGANNDNEPFRGSETKSVYIGSGGYDNEPFYWHRPNDIPENVPVDCVEITYQLFREYMKRIQGV
ncbi:M28 family metallopeptidase [Candidatus Latescibacterota bacterium]